MFGALKQKATNLGQKALVKLGQAEEFKETDSFEKTIENFKASRQGVEEIVKKGKIMTAALRSASAAKLAYFQEVASFAQKSGVTDPRILKFTESLTRYEQYSADLPKALDAVAIMPQSELYEQVMQPANKMRHDLDDLRTSRDAANRERSKETGTFKTEKAASEYSRLDEKYKTDREVLLGALLEAEQRKTEGLLLQMSLMFEEMYKMHATSYSDMATLEPEVRATIGQLQASKASSSAVPSPSAPQ
ncbi:uncharacterized protein MONOS_1370 [Monocercomonoides exilis]|uniref:uncharacterized protein n=1 Tax=Monocercomonoides exilis TaxID=2049356 RepID=UPI003559ED42|nr:hypothetical protein MONOS_1370 [Monocercomonoides exilis]|eukprot:MONOS_1370.1-p1 / transcript=MONOS_1370.1 / gene=MONOS_1370 / organism=Monocercomonoides_exilis_PA203 / gene_product=unspecified product / transcript_product=unspecified product / location=Mono_scaffold00023:206469-207741(-) / protein_length=248 / sequence_SO=supercontig / SO=protein_coding / is_pseudo=false